VGARQRFLLAENPRPPRHKGSGQLHGPEVYRRIVPPSCWRAVAPPGAGGSATYFESADEDHEAMHLTVQITPLPRPITSGQRRLQVPVLLSRSFSATTSAFGLPQGDPACLA
jgi:hypothetical protein